MVDLTKPTSMELPPVELGKQMVSLLDANLTLSKPMISDVAALQAQVGGVTDPQAIEQQSQMAAEMVSSMAVGTQTGDPGGYPMWFPSCTTPTTK